MKGFFMLLVFVVFAVFTFAGVGVTKETERKSGETLFKENCSPCHPDGGNIVNPQKTLHKKDLDTNNVRKPTDIMNKMRNPGPGMTKFDDKAISDGDAIKIAEYILKTFK